MIKIHRAHFKIEHPQTKQIVVSLAFLVLFLQGQSKFSIDVFVPSVTRKTTTGTTGPTNSVVEKKKITIDIFAFSDTINQRAKEIFVFDNLSPNVITSVVTKKKKTVYRFTQVQTVFKYFTHPLTLFSERLLCTKIFEYFHPKYLNNT